MPKVVGIKFKKSPKIYFFEPGEYEFSEGMPVVVDTARGLEMGEVAFLPKDMEQSKIIEPLKAINRIATEKDITEHKRLEDKCPAVLKQTAQLVEKSKLEMKLVDVEYAFDGSKLIVYFTADGRVDFRDLVRELASTFKTRIELRQIGARDECKRMGGLAPCGRACCCSDHIAEYAHVNIKMAKNQNLSLNPAKISGLCGRLMCCLQYENSTYMEVNKRMPKLGSEVIAADKRTGQVVAINQLKELVKVKFATGETFEYIDLPLSTITFKGKATMADEVNKDEKVDNELKNLID